MPRLPLRPAVECWRGSEKGEAATVRVPRTLISDVRNAALEFASLGFYPPYVLHRSPLRRLGWLLAAVFQLVLPPFAATADARAEADGARAPVHVEAYGTRDCARVHPADCAICRVLATHATTTTVADVPAPVARVRDAAPVDAEHPFCAARAPGDPPQRAPPV